MTQIEPNEPPSFERLHKLVARGYVARIGIVQAQDVIELDHPTGAPSIFLYSDGRVIENVATGIDGAKENGCIALRIEAAENSAFIKFLNSVRAPTFWERTSDARRKLIANVTLWSFIIGGTIVLIAGFEWVVRHFR
jgi:hypothetical protein